jgi:hypothetical protein
VTTTWQGRIQRDTDAMCRAAKASVDCGRGFDGEYQVALARLHHSAFTALAEMDPRVLLPDVGPLAAQLVTPLVWMVTGLDLGPLETPDVVYWGYRWISLEQPTFVPSAGITSELLLTDPGKVAIEDVAWPFDAFRVQLPNPGCVIAYSGERGPVPIRSVQTLLWSSSRTKGIKELDAIGIDMSGLVGAGERAVATQMTIAVDQIVAMVSGRSVPTGIVRAVGPDGTSVYNNQRWSAGDTLASWISGAAFGAADDSPLSPPGLALDFTDEDNRAVKLCQRLVANLALYLSSEDAETRKPLWTPKTKGIGPTGKTWQIGSSVKISREVRDAANAVAVGRASSGPSVRSIVRGHFRNQAVGQRGLGEHRRIYIKPFWRGPEGGPVIGQKTYRVS